MIRKSVKFNQNILSWARSTFTLDYRSLAAFRILLGLLLIPYVIDLAPQLPVFFTDAGALTRREVYGNFVDFFMFPLFFFSENIFYHTILLIILLISVFAFTVGYRTRLASFICWYILSCFIARSPLAIYAGDWILRFSLFWGIFLPLGGRWSVDAWRTKSTLPQQNLYFSISSICIVIQIFIMYFFAGLSKTNASWAFSGDPTYFVLHFDMYSSAWAKLVQDAPLIFFRASTFMTLFCELFLSFLIFLPLKKNLNRWLFIFIFCSFHLFIAFFMHLTYFPWICIILILVLTPSNFWDHLQKKSFQNSIDVEHFPKSVTIYLGLLITGLFFLNLTDILTFKTQRPPFFLQLKYIERSLGVTQYWNLFAPIPLRDNGWFIVKGTLVDGRVVDVFRNGGPVLEERPPDLRATYSNYFWIKYFQSIKMRWYSKHIWGFRRYLCTSWNSRHQGVDRVKHVEVSYRFQRIPKPGQPWPPLKTVSYGERTCSSAEPKKRE